MDIEVTPCLVKCFMLALSRHSGLHKLLDDMEQNVGMLRFWANYDEDGGVPV